MTEPDIITIDQSGDVLLHVQDARADVDQRFRCSRKLLSQKSRYFDVLLDPNKFSEGKEVESQLNSLSKRHPNLVSIPAASLPRVVIKDIGEIPATESQRVVGVVGFLRILHRKAFEQPWGDRTDETEGGSSSTVKMKSLPQQALTRATLLVILAEQMAATEIIRPYLIATHTRQPFFDYTNKARSSHKSTEIYYRRRIIVGMFMGYDALVMVSSAALLCDFSTDWSDDGVSTKKKKRYRLLHGLEEELECRRECILKTLNSLVSYLLGQYMGKKQQCKLGYDTSPQCDSFQLGQMIRFLVQKDLLDLQSTFSPEQQQVAYTHSITTVVERLRECPSYQLDANHQHCGLRSRILPLLSKIWSHSRVGICLRCWNSDPLKESWLTNPVGGTWCMSDSKIPEPWTAGDCIKHEKWKALYTANMHVWSSSP